MMTAPSRGRSERAMTVGSGSASSYVPAHLSNHRFRDECKGLPLTVRELDCLTRAAHGLTDQATALALGLSKQTVKNHLTVVNAKLGVDGRIEAFIALGWLKPPAVRRAA